MKKLDEFSDAIEPWVAYIALGLLALLEILSIFIPSVSELLDRRGEIAILVIVLLLILRRVSRHLEQHIPVLTSPSSFSASLNDVVDGATKRQDAFILANDGSKYYQLIGDCDIRLGTIRVLLTDDSLAGKWSGLVAKDKARAVTVRKTQVPPVLHMFGVENGRVMFGAFAAGNSDSPSPIHTHVIDVTAGQGLLVAHSMLEIFNSLWVRASQQP